MIEVRYNLNMVPDKGSPIHINVSQNDDKCRTFIFKLYSSDGSWTAPASATSTIEGRKDDGKFFSFACTYSNGEVTVIVQQQMVAVAGKVRCKIKLVSGAETIESAPFYFVVNPKSMPVNADMSKSDVVDAVAKATQKIVDQVAENIPEDYVKLNEDVSGLKQELDDLHDDYISNMFNVNTEQIWNPYSVVYGGYIRCNGQYVESETSHYFEFDVVEGETYRFSTPDSTQAGGTKAGSANYICPVLADGSYYYSDANAQTWKSTYTVPIGSGIVKIILSNPNSRLSDGYYSISTFAFNSSHPYARRFSNKSADIRKTVNHNRLKALKTENGMLDINHRGMSVYYAPNSLTAFYGSASAGYKFVETDVQRTMDGHFVILHDGTTTSATGTVGSVAEMTLDQVRVLNLKVSSSLIPSTEKIPTLEEALECFHATHITPVIELKKETITTENVHDLIDILEKWGQDYIIISLCHQFQTQSGTYPLLLEEVRSISEDIIIAPTMYDNMSYTLINKIHDAFGVNTIVCMDNDTIVESLSKTNLKNYVDYIHSLGMLAEFGTVNYKQKYEYGKQFGFDFCCTNFLMNNHKVDGQTVIEKVGTYGKGTAKTITITLPSDLTTYKDIIRVRGILESASDITITDGNAYHEYVFSAISPKIIDYQIYARNGSTITISSESDINYWKLAWSVTKALW